MCLDLKFDISIEMNIRIPTINNTICFFLFADDDFNSKNIDMMARTAVTIITHKASISGLKCYLKLITYQNIFYLNLNITMKPELQEKIKKYREQKNIKSAFQKSIESNRTKLKQYGRQINGSSKPHSNLDEFLKLNQNRYIQYTKQLIQTKNKQTQLSHKLEDLKTEVFFQQKKVIQLKNQIEENDKKHETLLSQRMQKYEAEKNQKNQMYDERICKNIANVEQLLQQKQNQVERTNQFINKKKQFESTKAKIKEAHELQLRTNKQKFLQQEATRRKNWEASKSQEMQQRTLKNLQPEIQRIVQGGKNQINKIKQQYEQQIAEFTRVSDETYQQAIRGINKEQALRLQSQRQEILREYAQKNRKQVQQKQQQFEQQRTRARNDYQKQIRDLQHERNRQSEQFLRKGKYFYMENLTEIRNIREEYQKEVKQLDGKVQAELQAKQIELRPKYLQKIQQFKQASKKRLLKLIQTYDKQKQKSIGQNLSQLCNEIAIQNAAYQRKISKQTDLKIKQEKQNSQLEFKQFRKTIVALEKKLQILENKRLSQRNQKEEYETEYLQAKSNNQFLIRKLHQLNNDIADLKVDESSVELRKQERKQEISRMWSKQIESIKQSLKLAEEEIQMQDSVMKEQQERLKEETAEIIKQIERDADKICQKKRKNAEGLIIKIEQIQKFHDSLEKLIQKQQQYEKLYMGKK